MSLQFRNLCANCYAKRVVLMINIPLPETSKSEYTVQFFLLFSRCCSKWLHGDTVSRRDWKLLVFGRTSAKTTLCANILVIVWGACALARREDFHFDGDDSEASLCLHPKSHYSFSVGPYWARSLWFRLDISKPCASTLSILDVLQSGTAANPPLPHNYQKASGWEWGMRECVCSKITWVVETERKCICCTHSLVRCDEV